MTPGAAPLDRRAFMASLSALGLGGTALPAALWAQTNGARDAVTRADIAAAVRVAGLDFSDEEVDLMVEEVNGMRERYAQLRTMRMPNSVVPALHFEPVLPGTSYPAPSASDRLPLHAAPGARAARRPRGTGFPAGDGTGRTRPRPAGDVDRTHGDVPRPAERARRHAAGGDRAHRGARHAAGGPRRRGDRARLLPGSAARDPLGGEGPPLGGRNPHDVGRQAV